MHKFFNSIKRQGTRKKIEMMTRKKTAERAIDIYSYSTRPFFIFNRFSGISHSQARMLQNIIIRNEGLERVFFFSSHSIPSLHQCYHL